MASCYRQAEFHGHPFYMCRGFAAFDLQIQKLFSVHYYLAQCLLQLELKFEGLNYHHRCPFIQFFLKGFVIISRFIDRLKLQNL